MALPLHRVDLAVKGWLDAELPGLEIELAGQPYRFLSGADAAVDRYSIDGGEHVLVAADGNGYALLIEVYARQVEREPAEE